MIGIIYFVVVACANTIGIIAGMGGGILIKPMFDLIGVHSVSQISFYSTIAVFTMSIISTGKQLTSSKKFNWKIINFVSLGAILGGILGNIALDFFLNQFDNEKIVQLIQIVITVLTLLFAFSYLKFNWKNFKFDSLIWYCICGLVLGLLASLLGIGGGPINVSLLMLMFALPIKEATMYSICTIFFSQFSKLIAIAFSTGFFHYDLKVLIYIVPAAIIGGLVGTKLSNILSSERTIIVFQTITIIVILINIYNGYQIFQ